MLSDTNIELHKEVLNLFRLILGQETSPFRSSSSEFSIHVGNVTISSSPTAETGPPAEKWDANHIDVSSPATSTNFYSKTWLQQKRLLEREFRRLLIWDAGINKSSSGDHGIDVGLAETSITALAHTLAESLRDNMTYRDQVNHIMEFLRQKHRAQSNLERGRQPAENADLLKDIQAQVDLLLKSLHSHKRKHTSDSTDAPLRPAKTSTREGRSIESVSVTANHLQETIPPRESKNLEISPDRQIVLKIANKVNGFREAPDLPPTSPLRSPANPQRTKFKMLNRKEFPSNLIHNDEDSLIKELKELQPKEQNDPDNIPSSLIGMARFREESLWNETNTSHLMSITNKSLQTIDSCLALHASLPEWQIHFMRGKNQYAKSAVSIICFSILNEIANCTRCLVSDMVDHLTGERERVSSVAKPLVFFYACIEKLSQQNKEMGTPFQLFQPDIDQIIASLEVLRLADDTGLLSGKSNATFRHCEPLSLACYSPSTADQTMLGTLHLDEDEIPSGLESLVVRDLFGAPSKPS